MVTGIRYIDGKADNKREARKQLFFTGSVEVKGSSPFGSTIVSLYIARDYDVEAIYSSVKLVVLSAICPQILIKIYLYRSL